jgi:hypothetical protein
MNLLTTIEAFFEGPVWSFLKPFIAATEAQGGTILIAAAEAGVAAGFAATGGGAAAMTAALGVFESQVVSNGLPFVESQGRALIEVALQNAKALVPAPAVPAAPTLTVAETVPPTA